MKLHTRYALAAGLLLSASQAGAVMVVNEDDEPHTITMQSGEQSETMTIDALASREIDCPSGCVLMLETGASESVEDDAQIAIRSGAFAEMD
jgi:hypothetical protein